MVCPSEFGVDSHPKISESVNPFQRCAIEAVGVMEPFTFICYSHDLAFGLVKISAHIAVILHSWAAFSLAFGS